MISGIYTKTIVKTILEIQFKLLRQIRGHRYQTTHVIKFILLFAHCDYKQLYCTNILIFQYFDLSILSCELIITSIN